MTVPASPAPAVVTGSAARAAQAGGLAVVGSVLAVLVVATVGKGLGAEHVKQLQAAALGFLTVVGVAIATAVWVLIGRRAAHPRALLSRLVPVVLLLSLVPDLALGFGDTGWGAVVTLMLAHLAVFAVTVPLLARLLPVRA